MARPASGRPGRGMQTLFQTSQRACQCRNDGSPATTMTRYSDSQRLSFL